MLASKKNSNSKKKGKRKKKQLTVEGHRHDEQVARAGHRRRQSTSEALRAADAQLDGDAGQPPQQVVNRFACEPHVPTATHFVSFRFGCCCCCCCWRRSSAIGGSVSSAGRRTAGPGHRSSFVCLFFFWRRRRLGVSSTRFQRPPSGVRLTTVVVGRRPFWCLRRALGGAAPAASSSPNDRKTNDRPETRIDSIFFFGPVVVDDAIKTSWQRCECRYQTSKSPSSLLPDSYRGNRKKIERKKRRWRVAIFQRSAPTLSKKNGLYFVEKLILFGDHK